MTTTKQTLIKARGLIDEPSKWTKLAWARNSRQISCAMDNSDAQCFCLGSSLILASPPLEPKIVNVEIENQLPIINGKVPTIAEYNDHPDTTHADIMNLFDKAIEAAE